MYYYKIKCKDGDVCGKVEASSYFDAALKALKETPAFHNVSDDGLIRRFRGMVSHKIVEIRKSVKFRKSVAE